MSNTIIQIKSSSSSGNTPSVLQPGELAINIIDGNLFYGNVNSHVVLFDTIAEPAGLNTEIQFNKMGSFGSNSDFTYSESSNTLSVPIISTNSLTVGGYNVELSLLSFSNNSIITGSYANSAFTVANTASNTAISAGVFANTAITNANTANNNAVIADQRAVTSGSYANSAFAIANTDVTTISTTAGIYGNNSIVPVITLAANGRISSVSNVAINNNVLNATDDTSTSILYPVFVGAAGSTQIPKVTTTKLQWNASTGSLSITGSLFATSKSFRIDHPTKQGMSLTYGSLEGPENGVYVRGRLTGSNEIVLPEYWTKLVDTDSITVNLTPIGAHQKLYVKDIVNNTVVVGNENLFGKTDCFYTVFAERCDVDKLEVEI